MRQVGKTWLMKEFGRCEYKDAVYVNFDNNRQMAELFSLDLRPERIVEGLELFSGCRIVPEETLLIFDEIQEVPKALSSLKYFCEDAPQYPVVCAGGLLGVALHQGTSFPVGKVDFLDLAPMSFQEFMLAVGKERFVKVLQDGDFELANTFRSEYEALLKQYYCVGGMPEAVAAFAERKDFSEVRGIRRRILAAYEQDFSKHAPYDVVPRIRMLWESILAQLARENKKFIYGLISEGARAKEYEMAILWLADCGLVHKVSRVSVPKPPLKAYEDLKAFKLYLLDVGLLSCLSGLKPRILLSGSAEIDFLFDCGELAAPLEVKAETNLLAKSLKVYHEKFQPPISVRTSMSPYKREGWLLNVPLWAIGQIKELMRAALTPA